MRKMRLLYSLIGIALLVLISGMLIRIRGCQVTSTSAQALWNRDDLYLFVEQNKMAWSENLWAFLWGTARNTLGLTTPPQFKRIDCLVYHATRDKTDEHLVKGWHVVGTLAPYGGIPHAFIGGGPDTRGVYRWTGNDFVRLSPSEAAALESGFTYTDELFTREGWAKAEVLPVRGAATYNLVLGGTPFTLKATQVMETTQSKVSTDTRIELVGSGSSRSTNLLYKSTDKFIFLDAKHYQNFVDK